MINLIKILPLKCYNAFFFSTLQVLQLAIKCFLTFCGGHTDIKNNFIVALLCKKNSSLLHGIKRS